MQRPKTSVKDGDIQFGPGQLKLSYDVHSGTRGCETFSKHEAKDAHGNLQVCDDAEEASALAVGGGVYLLAELVVGADGQELGWTWVSAQEGMGSLLQRST